jgi:hypothetical protein
VEKEHHHDSILFNPEVPGICPEKSDIHIHINGKDGEGMKHQREMLSTCEMV